MRIGMTPSQQSKLVVSFKFGLIPFLPKERKRPRYKKPFLGWFIPLIPCLSHQSQRALRPKPAGPGLLRGAGAGDLGAQGQGVPEASAVETRESLPGVAGGFSWRFFLGGWGWGVWGRGGGGVRGRFSLKPKPPERGGVIP